MVVEFTVSEEEAGQRADHAVRRRLPDVPRRLLLESFEAGKVRLGGTIAKKSTPVAPGQLCRLDIDWPSTAPVATQGHLDVLWESDRVVVVDKPAGLASAALAGSVSDSVASRLLARYPSMATIGYSAWDAGLLHRLDTFTSGVLVAAKNRETFEELQGALGSGLFHKTYLAWSTHCPEPMSAVIDTPLRADRKNQRRMVPAKGGRHRGRACETAYQVLGVEQGYALVRATASIATRHQVRAHLASVGAPLVGDALYGGSPIAGLDRHALHAESVRYEGGRGCPAFTVCAPIPTELAHLTPGLARTLSLAQGCSQRGS